MKAQEQAVVIGADIMQISRMGRALKRRPGLRERLFSSEERRYCEARANAAQHYAARFAAKEAVAKALGRSLSWREVEILRETGAPYPILHGRARELVGGGRLQISLSHSGDYAMACALFICG